MDDPFESPRMLIDDAEERIAGLEKIIEAFVGHQDRAISSEFDAKSGKHLLYVQYPTAIPPKISMDIRGIARDLRDALDHAVYASSVTIFGGDPAKTKFLVADTPDGIQQDIKRHRCKDVHEDIVALMVKENATEAGNPAIWSLNKFRNHSSHRVIGLANAGSGGVGINSARGGLTFDSMNEWRSTSRRLYFAKIRLHGPELELNISPTVEVRTHPQFGLGNVPAPVGLRNVVSEVRRLVREIKDETTNVVRKSRR
jgi:hypothetical protein